MYGGVNPPHYYYMHEEINEALTAAGVAPQGTEYDQQVVRVTLTPTVLALPMPLTPTLVNIPGNHYRMGAAFVSSKLFMSMMFALKSKNLSSSCPCSCPWSSC